MRGRRAPCGRCVQMCNGSTGIHTSAARGIGMACIFVENHCAALDAAQSFLTKVFVERSAFPRNFAALHQFDWHNHGECSRDILSKHSSEDGFDPAERVTGQRSVRRWQTHSMHTFAAVHKQQRSAFPFQCRIRHLTIEDSTSVSGIEYI